MRELTYSQRASCDALIENIHGDASVIEGPSIDGWNDPFGWVAYLTMRFPHSDPRYATYIEYGIKPNGDIFVVR